ncbi:MAG: aldehyde ferredoxin oxidoreductase family protein, partial [Candidatus Thermoplasmatota archaeon]|nr:aldehyde ferredoxin oxidoreductase family protein [Candidatus Thermoplasmatota archaeon]
RLRKFIGAKGVGVSLLVEQDTSKDPLEGGNPLIFATGPLTGTTIQTSARSTVVTRSPLTGGALDSHAGGHFGPALRRAGWDYVSIRGASKDPVYLVISPDGVEFRDAGDLWGKDAFETEKTLRSRHEKSKVACIGQAGENLVRFAAICTELYRHYGRGGAGAVMGSKKLKAVVATGSEKVAYADHEKYRELSMKLTSELKEHPNAKKRYELGTMMWIRMGQEIGRFLPTHNFKHGQFEHYENITSETMRKELGWKSMGCYGCGVILCSKFAKWDGKEMEGPEYETTAYLGSNCELASAKEVATANWLCDKYGLDTISSGVVISFALECAEKGLLSPEDNQRLKFGDAESVYALIEEIALRKGLGDVLAEGTRIASKEIGQGSEYFAIQIGGMELSGVNPLGSYSMALSLATSDFASHTRFWSATDEMNGNLKLETLAPYIIAGQDEVNARNSMVVCDFLPYGFDRLAPFLNASTGFDYTVDEIKMVGERIQSMARKYNMEKGRTHADDTLPARFFEEPSCAGLMEGKKIPRDFFEKQVQEIFETRGWDKNGMPKKETLKRLGL